MTKKLKKHCASREEILYRAWYEGKLSYKLRQEQKHLKNLLDHAPKGIAVFNISRRFGKTTTCVNYADEKARKKKTKIIYATAFKTDLENFIMPIFDIHLQDCPQQLLPQYKKARNQWEYPNGSILKLVGLDKNPNALRGNAIDDLIIDEASFVKNLEYIYRSIIVPATMSRKFRIILPSTPPESPEHFWAKVLIPKAKSENRYVELTIDDIKDLPMTEKQRLLDEVGGKDSVTAQREFYCKIIADTNRSVANTFNQALHVQQYVPEVGYWQLFGDTGGVRDKTYILKACFSHVYNKIVVTDELVFDNKTPTAQIIRDVRQKFPGLPLVLDAPGQTLVDFSSMGLPAMLPMKDDFNAGLQMLNTAFYNNEILINPNCHFLIRSLQGSLLNRQRTDFERSDELGHADAIAALIYCVRMIDRNNHFPIQLDGTKYYTRQDQPHELTKLCAGIL